MHFTDVDRSQDPDFFVRFMDEAQKPAGIQASKQRMLDRMALVPGAAVSRSAAVPGPTCWTWRMSSAPAVAWSGSTPATS
jgi:hypothetical protein